SIDSRNNAIGTVSKEHIVGKLVFKIWPLSELGLIE
ncbi:signal peptidase I, partial [Streptococcus suis]